ncbi:MAG: HDOD domain-containing protein [Nitrospirae bacterium]|nr:HDOD domain-containing protein [Nitrospirota bacterium]
MPSVIDIAREVKALPAMSVTAQRVIEITHNPRANAAGLQDVILYDQALSTHLLRVANSPFYSPRVPVTEVQRAVVLLGFEQVKKICIFYATKGILKRPGLAETLLWEHSLGTSIAARVVAEHWQPDIAAQAFTAGLLHDVGKSVLMGIPEADYESLLRTFYNESIPLAELERDRYGFDHAYVGAQVSLHWKLPQVLVKAIAHHHGEVPADLTQDQTDLTRILRLANRFAHAAGIGRREPLATSDWGAVAENPGFPGAAVAGIFDHFMHEYEQERARMDVAAM